MRLAIPYDRRKRYLTGNDWILTTFHHLTRSATGEGNLSQIVLELDGELPRDRLERHLAAVLPHYPVLAGRIRRDWNYCPYWNVPRRGRPPRPPIEFAAPADVPPERALEPCANRRLRSEREHLAFRLQAGGAGPSHLAMTFDHRLFDAHGAEMLLQLIQEHHADPARAPLPAHVAPAHPTHLDRWADKFRSGRAAHRAFYAMAGDRMAVLPLPARLRDRPYRFRVLTLDAAAAAAVVERAYREAGYLMLMPYLLAASIRTLAPAFRACGAAEPDFLVPVSLDARSPATRHHELFFNHVSFLFFQAAGDLLADPPALLASLTRQMYEQVKSELPRHMDEAAMLMRVLPPSVLGAVMHLPLQGKRGSFGFAYVGESAFTAREFLGVPVRNVFHMPRVTVPPGIGVFFNRFGGRMNVTFSYIDGMLPEAEADRFIAALGGLLGADGPRAGAA